MKFALLFAGQGSQTPGMGKDLYENCETFRRVFDLLPEELRNTAFEGPMEILSDTRNTQPILTAFSAGILASLRELLQDKDFSPAAAAGLSLGEYAALHAAGVWDAATAVRLVTERGLAMHKAAEGIACSMYAVMGLDREVLQNCCQQAEPLGVVEITNDNCPGQLVIAGEKEAVEKCAGLASDAGARRCVPLPVSGPFHTRFMKPAGQHLAKLFEETEFAPMQFPVIFNAAGRPKTETETVEELLVRQVSSGVRFTETIRWLEKEGVDTVLEIGPGKTLSGFVRKTCRGINCISIDSFESLQQAAEKLKEELA